MSSRRGTHQPNLALGQVTGPPQRDQSSTAWAARGSKRDYTGVHFTRKKTYTMASRTDRQIIISRRTTNHKTRSRATSHVNRYE